MTGCGFGGTGKAGLEPHVSSGPPQPQALADVQADQRNFTPNPPLPPPSAESKGPCCDLTAGSWYFINPASPS